jgi:hypothetical protein
MDTTAILMATTIGTVVTGIVMVMDQGLAPVIGDEIIGQGGRKIFGDII